MNPKCEDRNPGDQIPRISDIIGSALNLPEIEEIISTVVSSLKQNSVLTKDKVLALRPYELVELLDKNSKKFIHKD